MNSKNELIGEIAEERESIAGIEEMEEALDREELEEEKITEIEEVEAAEKLIETEEENEVESYSDRKEKTEVEISLDEIEKIKSDLEIDRKKLNRRKLEFTEKEKIFNEEKLAFQDEKEIFENEKIDFNNNLLRSEKMLGMKKRFFEKKEKDFSEKEKELEDLLNIIATEKESLTEKTFEIRNQCSKEFLETIESLKERNIELANEVKDLRSFKINYEILENKIKGKEESIELLKKELLEVEEKLKVFESINDLDKLVEVSNLREKIKSFEKENKNLKIEVEKYKENKNIIKEQDLEISNLNDCIDIYKGRMERQTSFIEHLKRSEKSKGSGEDTTEAIFEEIIEKENNNKIINSVIKYDGDENFVRGFTEFAEGAGFVYSKDLIRAFIASIKSSKLTILKGYSGTGKSSLPELIGKYLMAECITIAVQPNWRTKQDILGFYNYFTNKFIPTELTKAIIKANVNKDKIFMVVLDEMNLARVEYYFSEFNSKIWLEEEKRKVELFEGVSNYGEKVSSIIEDNKVKIPDNMIFIGTINEDDSVSPISDKIFDRAQVVEFKELPNELAVGNLNNADSPEENKFTNYRTFISKRDFKNNKIDKSKKLVKRINTFTKEHFDKVIGYRSIGQINEFIDIYVNSGGEEWKALDWQLMSKFSPKIKFIYEKEDIDSLELLKMDIEEYFRDEFNLKDSTIDELLFIKEIEKISKGGQ